MAEQEHHHHHHHHHHKPDGATIFKRNSLKAIKRNKIIRKWAFRILCCIAVIMAIAVVVVYTLK